MDMVSWDEFVIRTEICNRRGGVICCLTWCLMLEETVKASFVLYWRMTPVSTRMEEGVTFCLGKVVGFWSGEVMEGD